MFLCGCHVSRTGTIVMGIFVGTLLVSFVLFRVLIWFYDRSKRPKPPRYACPECGGAMVYETRPDTIEWNGNVQSLPMEAWWCTQCDEGIFWGEPLAERERKYLEWKAGLES